MVLMSTCLSDLKLTDVRTAVVHSCNPFQINALNMEAERRNALESQGGRLLVFAAGVVTIKQNLDSAHH